MNKNIVKLVMLAMGAHSRKNSLLEVNECLKLIFKASDIKYHDRFITGKKEGTYLPVIVNGKNIGYYEIINHETILSNEEFNFIIMILSQMHFNIGEYSRMMNEMKVDKVTGLYHKGYFDAWCKKTDFKSISKLSCVLIDVMELREINNSFGYIIGDDMLKATVQEINKVFYSNYDMVFRYSGSKIIILVKNQDNVILTNRINKLRDLLKSIDINVAIGLSSGYDSFDIYHLIDIAERNLNVDKKSYSEKKWVLK